VFLFSTITATVPVEKLSETGLVKPWSSEFEEIEIFTQQFLNYGGGKPGCPEKTLEAGCDRTNLVSFEKKRIPDAKCCL